MVIIQEETTKNPITLMGKEAGICYDSADSPSRNYKRGLECLETNHGRVLEFPQVYMIIGDHSAKFARELYTHIGGAPTRLQASTRYVDYRNKLNYIIPHTIYENDKALKIYEEALESIRNATEQLAELNIPKEDYSMLYPLGMTSKVVVRTNLRNLIDMSHQRMCTRAFWEFRNVFSELDCALSNYSEEWKYIVENYFMPKCQYLGYCPEKNSCGKMPKRQ